MSSQPQHQTTNVQKKGFESTVRVCHRTLESRTFEIKNGGARIVFLHKPLAKQVPNCRDFNFYVMLTRSIDWWPDSEIGTCEGSTATANSFEFGNLSPGNYSLTIWRNFDHPYCCLESDLMVFDEARSGDTAGCTRREHLTALDIVHGALDIAGFVPVLGAIPDGINAAIYAAEGDWANAGLSAVAMVPLWGDGVKLGAVAGKSAIKLSEKAAFRLGEEGIAKGLKEIKAASHVERATAEAAKVEEEAAKLERAAAGDARAAERQEARAAKQESKEAEREAKKVEKAKEREAKEAEKAEEREQKGKGGKWTCYGRSAVLQIPSALPEHKCALDGQYIEGPPMSAATEAAACLAAKHAFNAMMPRGCRPKHLACRCSKR